MRRADRLFRVVEFLKARRHAVRAQDIAEHLEVSLRTVYRDIADLTASGTPIRGEAGVGYQLDQHHVLRPLMFSVEEIEALVLGTEMVKSWSDTQLSHSAASALDKIKSVLPAQRALEIGESFIFSLPCSQRPDIRVDMAVLRRAIKLRQYLKFHYQNEQNQRTQRQVRPLCLALFAPIWLLLGWCELRNDFRNFRLDRIDGLTVEGIRFREEQGKRLKDYLKLIAQRPPQ